MGVNKEYKTDCTKGSSIINPMKYKGDVLVQVWVDSRILATLDRWLEKEGSTAGYMSQVVRRPLEVLVKFLVDNNEVVLVDDTNEARKMLERKFKVQLNRGRRGMKNALHNKTLSARKGELGEISREGKIDVVNRAVNRDVTNYDLKEVEKLMESDEVKKRAEELGKWRDDE